MAEPPIATDSALKAILHEAEAIQAGVNRNYNAIYTTFGVVLPALVGIFALSAKDLKFDSALMPKVALIFVMVFSLSGLWAQSLWMELLRYVRYRYIVLLPRLYRATGQLADQNFLQWSGRRTPRNSSAILLFNIGCFAVLLLVHIAFMSAAPIALQMISILFIAAVTASNIAVMREATDLEKAIEESTSTSSPPSTPT